MTSIDRRSPLVAAACLGAAFGAVVILAYSGGHVSKMTSGDGLFYRYVAAHLDAGRSDLAPIVAARGPSIRYGRIALPVMIWILSAGRPGAMPYAQPLIMVAAAAASAAAAKRLFPERGPLVALVPFVALGITLSIAGGYAEGVAVAFVLWAVVSIRSERWATASVLLALAVLARENAAVVVFGLVVWSIWERRWRTATILAVSVVPAVAWHIVVAIRFGHLPLADPSYYNFVNAEPIPFLALLKGLYDYSVAATLTAATHLALWIVAIVLTVRRRTLYSLVATAAGLQLAAVPLLNWQYAGDTFRLFSFLEVFTVLALASVIGTTAVSPSPARPGGAG